VEDLDIENLSDKDFCEFIATKWKETLQENTINIRLEHNGSEKDIRLTKTDLSS